MKKNITKTEIIANELLLERYKPIMIIQLSRTTTQKLSNKLKQFAEDIPETVFANANKRPRRPNVN